LADKAIILGIPWYFLVNAMEQLKSGTIIWVKWIKPISTTNYGDKRIDSDVYLGFKVQPAHSTVHKQFIYNTTD